MKIICTEHEKAILAEMRIDSGICPFELKFCSKEINCMECFDNNIEWEIKDGEQE